MFELHRRPLRILLYSHDTVGLGHLRRNQAIALALANALSGASVVIVSGARQCTLFDIPKSIELVTIPSVKKCENGHYVARHAALRTGDTMRMRREIIHAVVQSFQPDVLIADKVPRGIYGELEPSLQFMRARRAVCILGLRDILDDSQSVRAEWREERNESAIAEYYDAVWVYGDRRVCDPAAEYNLSPSTGAKLSFMGYLHRMKLDQQCDPGEANELGDLATEPRRLQVCMVGGGEDGAALATTFAHATFAPDALGVIVSGPYMPDQTRTLLRERADANPALRVLEFLRHPEKLLSRAERVVAMGGYNTVCELLAHGKPALIVPRVTPRAEQRIRAERLHAMGLLEWMPPTALSPDSLSQWLQQPVSLSPAASRLDMAGLDRIPELLLKLVQRRGDPAGPLASPWNCRKRNSPLHQIGTLEREVRALKREVGT